MPQREFWTERHPVEVKFNYLYVPTGSDDSAFLSMSVHDQAGKIMAHRSMAVPLEWIEDAVPAALAAGFRGYLLGTPQDGPDGMRRVLQAWWKAGYPQAR